MKKKINQQEVDYIRIRADKNLDPKSTSYDDVILLCDQATALLKESSFLKEKLFDLEQNVPEEFQWENILSSKLERVLQQNIKKDYLEFTNSINNDIFVVTIQKKFGKTPEQLREQSDIRRLKAVQKIVNLLKQNQHMQMKLTEQAKDIFALKAVRFPNAESQLRTQEEIQRAIDLLNGIIKSYNSLSFRRWLSKLQPSMRSSFHESWNRAAEAESKVSRLEKENLKLKQELLQKKNPISRLHRKRGK